MSARDVFFRDGEAVRNYFENTGTYKQIPPGIVKKLWRMSATPVVKSAIQTVIDALGADAMHVEMAKDGSSSSFKTKSSSGDDDEDKNNNDDEKGAGAKKQISQPHEYMNMWNKVYESYYKPKLPEMIARWICIMGFVPIVFVRIPVDGSRDHAWMLKNQTEYDEKRAHVSPKKRYREMFTIPMIPSYSDLDFYVAAKYLHEPNVYAVINEERRRSASRGIGVHRRIRVLTHDMPDMVTGLPTSPAASLLDQYDFLRWCKNNSMDVAYRRGNPIPWARVRDAKQEKDGNVAHTVMRLDGKDLVHGNTASKLAPPVVRLLIDTQKKEADTGRQDQRRRVREQQTKALLESYANAMKDVSDNVADFLTKIKDEKDKSVDNYFPLPDDLELSTQPPVPEFPFDTLQYNSEFIIYTAALFGVPVSFMGAMPSGGKSGGGGGHDLSVRAKQDDRRMNSTIKRLSAIIEADVAMIHALATMQDRPQILFKLHPRVGVDMESVLELSKQVLSHETALEVASRHYDLGIDLEKEADRKKRQRDDEAAHEMKIKNAGKASSPSSKPKKKKAKTTTKKA